MVHQSMTDQYRKDQIVRVAVPAWRRDGDRRWIREWVVQLVVPPPSDWRTRLTKCEQAGVETAAELLPDGRTLHLTCATELDPFSDELFLVAAYRMLQRIDEHVGEIALIEGQPRHVWQPFRSEPPR
jgi:hypothetical protein